VESLSCLYSELLVLPLTTFFIFLIFLCHNWSYFYSIIIFFIIFNQLFLCDELYFFVSGLYVFYLQRKMIF
jgi:hypothetical protein